MARRFGPDLRVVLVTGVLAAAAAFIIYCRLRVGASRTPGETGFFPMLLVASVVLVAPGAVLLGAAALGVVQLVVGRRLSHRLALGHCPRCGYEALGMDRCPECGGSAPWRGIRTRTALVRLVACVLVAVALGAIAGEAWVWSDENSFQAAARRRSNRTLSRERWWPNRHTQMHYEPARGLYSLP